MRAGTGYSENSDTLSAGVEASREALAQAGRDAPCDVVLLFATAQHDPEVLRDAVTSVLGSGARVIGGGAIGAITNHHYGYAGDQVALAALWLEGARCELAFDGGLLKGEFAAGQRLGKQLASLDAGRDTQVMLFYDGVDRTGGDVQLIMATPLLAGIEDGLGFLPDVFGAGMQGDYACSPTKQWREGDVVAHHAFGLVFKDGIRINAAVMHGCRPATVYYTVTKADRQTILEIDGKPALSFVRSILGPSIPPNEYAFFLTFGINHGEKWDRFDENLYVNHLCLGIDGKRDGIVMFESDMVEGTRFQIMQRSLDLEYMKPKIEALFANLDGRRPVFAFYIDCAGRAGGYAGIDLEDALIVQKATAGGVPLLGIYSGVEIAPVMGRPRPLDWTGVFCLFSVPR